MPLAVAGSESYTRKQVSLQEYRSQVSADPDIAELRELQRAQGQLGMQPSLPAQHAMPVAPAPMGQPMMPSMSMDGGGYVLATALLYLPVRPVCGLTAGTHVKKI